ncbi:hypothetical protein EJ03DRAFT_389791 [Teratosphaeria nubilosa]|uniref:Multicopper oxidase n=1 Tax=Teratosphaeria nubilosa TaxID=161662 RepID=A0A6G1L718_9PEZI|nr:hypothetical protein EJ03DRAFT_389791 [Teratosphaeria nubilosa]
MHSKVSLLAALLPCLSSKYPWGGRSVSATNPYDLNQIPNTGVTRKYEWTLTNETLAPDGVELSLLVVNGQYPGPLLECNWGDWLEVAVTNNLDEGSSIHWHGFLQTGTPYYDGTPGASQCPIAPGKTFTYRFRCELYGSSWWHSHYSGQYVSGLTGPIVVYGPTDDRSKYDVDVGPVMVTDWYHDYYLNLVADVFKGSLECDPHNPRGNPPCPPLADNVLINGKNSYPCDKVRQYGDKTLPCTENAPHAQFRFHSGKRHLLRLINNGAEAVLYLSIDGYQMTVIANDFVAVEPYETDLVTLGIGQRADVIVQGVDDPRASVYMRVTEGPSALQPPGDHPKGCSLNTGVSTTALAAIYYEDADTTVPPNSTSQIEESRYLAPDACQDQPLNLTVPLYEMELKEPETTMSLTVTGGLNASSDFVWYINNISLYADYNDPTLFEAKLNTPGYQYPPERAVYDMGSNASVRIILQAVGLPAPHPFHIHGHNMQVLSAGPGSWDGTIIRPENPQRRDTQILPPDGHIALQIELNNPGVWLFHCHVAWHISQGLGITILERPIEIEQEMELPYIMAQTCRDWSAYTGHDVVDQIDSGL